MAKSNRLRGGLEGGTLNEEQDQKDPDEIGDKVCNEHGVFHAYELKTIHGSSLLCGVCVPSGLLTQKGVGYEPVRGMAGLYATVIYGNRSFHRQLNI